MSTIELATVSIIGTALVLAPIDPQPIRDLNTPTPDPEPEPVVFDEKLARQVRDALDLRYWKPSAEHGETETRIILWSQLELNDLYERVGGTVTSRQVERSISDGTKWTAEEITVTIDVPAVGPVEATTDWCDGLEKYGSRDDLPLMQALTGPKPEILKTVPANGRALGYDQYAITPGAPLPDDRTIATVEDPLGSSWRVTDDQGAVHRLHKHGELIRYTSGTVSFIEPEWAGWSSD
ncbi:hypothetical protein STRTUCAR8_08576 [Streptomyces turgidiscabies Car8]|uniref:Uncharacterized protein n=1 Tax=Streptomyces turgidiscabies (strain Car8) TaxID=698760 RepID=L7F964_STRT8|nr:hypothetical protein [Streptomyces turgidiscabies]ELP67649.1 hypothetical protein STRTUCAR8_08576 [Streptomyces turgidiscabies Car8]